MARWTAVCAAVLVLLPGCGKLPASLDASTRSGGRTVELYVATLVVAVGVFAGVAALLGYALVRTRSAGSAATDSQAGPRLEITWTAGMAVVLAVLFAATIGVMRARASDGSASLEVRVVAHQWWWEYRYLDADGSVTTANELHLPVDTTVDLHVTSDDVIHSFWVPSFGAKADAIPGRSQTLTVEPVESGEFLGTCAEFCGLQHAGMRIRVVVESQSDFDGWLAQQRADAIRPPSELATQGEALFTSSACGSCHAIRGTDATGDVGPDLSHVGSRSTIGSGVLQNSPENLMGWIRDPDSSKPGALMPAFPNLSDQELSALAAYLEGLQ